MNSGKSKSYLNTLILSLIVTIAACFSLIPLTADIAGAEDQFDNLSLIGVVVRVYPAENVLVLKSTGGKRQKIVLTGQTAFKGVLLAKEIKVRQKIRVWYVLENDLFKALKIEVMPELGC